VLVSLAVNIWHKANEVGAIVGAGLGSRVGAVGRAVGSGDGCPGLIVGLEVGNALGFADGRAVVGLNVGTELGATVFVDGGNGSAVDAELSAAVVTDVGAAVGAYITDGRDEVRNNVDTGLGAALNRAVVDTGVGLIVGLGDASWSRLRDARLSTR